MATKKYDKVKLGLPAYITFGAFIIAIILMVILIVPSQKKRVRKMFQGSYTVSDTIQGGDHETKYYDVEEDHILKTYSFGDLKKQIKKDKYTYVIYGDFTSTEFCLDVVKMNELGKELGISKLVVLNSKKLSDKQKTYLKDKIKKVNSEVTSISKIPAFDLWVFKNDELIDCYSNPDYEDVDSETKLSMIARYHIFSYKN